MTFPPGPHHFPASTAGRRSHTELRRLASSPRAPIFLLGESGTGKTTLARLAHDWSPRRHAQFVRADLASMDDGLASSTLFGHEVGAYTGATRRRHGLFASAHGGTIFLDELGKSSLALQARLLHVVERGEYSRLGSDRTEIVDVRVIVAMSECPAELVARGQLLKDFYERFRAYRVWAPPLREMRADIKPLIASFLKREAAAIGYRHTPRLDPALEAVMCKAEWRGNIRELHDTIERLVIDCDGAEVIDATHCSTALEELREAADRLVPLTPDVVRSAVAEAGGSLRGAGRRLGRDPKTLQRLLA